MGYSFYEAPPSDFVNAFLIMQLAAVRLIVLKSLWTNIETSSHSTWLGTTCQKLQTSTDDILTSSSQGP